ncbi:hybrid sensor histidine kinase/response regulator [Halohasta litorea]|uniref:histidine kinase n=1 Tax=Halohasta litorea TaxID=869891 RepID=A0ABD6D4V6_9EURY|nr:ATP-binding protein [Halohasta litorea]
MSVFRVLHVDDDAAIGGLLETYLEESVDREEFAVTTARSVSEAETVLDEIDIDCIVCDYQMPGTDGLEFLRRIRDREPNKPFILFTNKGSADVASEAIEAGVTDYLRKGGGPEQYEVLANRIANAVQQERGRIARTQLMESTAVISGLYEVINETDLSFAQKLDRVLTIGTTELGYPIGYITHIEGDSLDVLAAVGDHEVIQEDATVPLDATYCKHTIEDGTPQAVSDAKRDDQWADSKALAETELQCYVGAPIIVDGEVYGTLCFASRGPQDSTTVEDDELTVKTLAQWVGYEIDRHEYERELKRQIDRLEEFTGVVSHDLRNPLNIAQGRIDIVKEECDSESVAPIDRALDRMEEIIEDTLTLARQGQTVDDSDIEPVAIDDVIDHSREIVETGGSELRLIDDFVAHADRNRLYQLFENLVRNAVEHSEGPVTIRVGKLDVMFTSTRVESDGTFGFYVEDDGPGVPEEKREEVFEAGESTNPQGTGFGLSIVKRIAEAHGWEVDLEESFDGGARFVFTNVR